MNREASIVIWTTTPGRSRATERSRFSRAISYGLYRVTDAPEGNWANVGDAMCLPTSLPRDVSKPQRSSSFERLGMSMLDALADWRLAPILSTGQVGGYAFAVPLLAGDHVTDDAGTGFVHTAPGHGREDFDMWTAPKRSSCSARARHRHAHPLHRRRERRLHHGRARLRGQARHHRQGREGRRQRGGHQGA